MAESGFDRAWSGEYTNLLSKKWPFAYHVSIAFVTGLWNQYPDIKLHGVQEKKYKFIYVFC